MLSLSKILTSFIYNVLFLVFISINLCFAQTINTDNYKIVFEDYLKDKNNQLTDSKILIKTSPNIVFNSISYISIEILCENFPSKWSDFAMNDPLFYIGDLKLYLVASEGYIQAWKPKYYVYTTESSEYIELTDIPERTREISSTLNSLAPSLIKSIPVAGTLYSLSENLMTTSDWINATETDYEKVYSSVKEFDEYPIFFPQYVSPSKPYKAIKILIPFKQIKQLGSIDVFIQDLFITYLTKEDIAIAEGHHHFSPITVPTKQPEVHRVTDVKNKLIHVYGKSNPSSYNKIMIETTDISSQKINLGLPYSNYELHISNQIIKSGEQNYINLAISPYHTPDVYVDYIGKLVAIEMALEIPKGKGAVNKIPVIKNEETILEFSTNRSLLGKKALTNWCTLGLGLINTQLNLTLNTVGAFQSIEDAALFNNYSFFEYLDDHYKDENIVNFFQFPITKFRKLYSPDIQVSNNFDTTYISIPVVFYSEKLPEEYKVYLHAKLLKNGLLSHIETETKEFYTKFTLNFKEFDLEEYAKLILGLIRDADFESLEEYIHPDGLTFIGNDLSFTKEEVSGFNSDYKRYNWGPSDGSDFDRKLIIKQYIEKYVYCLDFLENRKTLININSFINNGVESTSDNWSWYYNRSNNYIDNSTYVNFYLNPKSDGYWESVFLVFSSYKGKWLLRGIANDGWGP